MRAFRQGLKETGYIEGQNVAVEYHSAGGDPDRLRSLVTDMIRRRVAAIAGNTVAMQAAKSATTTIPIVFFTGGDPVEVDLSPASTDRAEISLASAFWVPRWEQSDWSCFASSYPTRQRLGCWRTRVLMPSGSEGTCKRQRTSRAATHYCLRQQRRRHRESLRGVRSTRSWCSVLQHRRLHDQ